MTHKACLKGAILRHADLTKADLKGANLENAKLYGANLTKANLREANMTGVRLAGADLSDADLRGVKGLHLSDLRSAKHRKARGLTHVYLKGFPRELMDRYTRLLKGVLRFLQRWLAGGSRAGGSSTSSRRNLPVTR